MFTKTSLTLIVSTNRQNTLVIWNAFYPTKMGLYFNTSFVVGSGTDYDADLINKLYFDNRKLHR